MQCKVVEHVFPCQLEMECKITRMKAGVIKLISYVSITVPLCITSLNHFCRVCFILCSIIFSDFVTIFFSLKEQPYHTLKTHE